MHSQNAEKVQKPQKGSKKAPECQEMRVMVVSQLQAIVIASLFLMANQPTHLSGLLRRGVFTATPRNNNHTETLPELWCERNRTCNDCPGTMVAQDRRTSVDCCTGSDHIIHKENGEVVEVIPQRRAAPEGIRHIPLSLFPAQSRLRSCVPAPVEEARHHGSGNRAGDPPADELRLVISPFAVLRAVKGNWKNDNRRSQRSVCGKMLSEPEAQFLSKRSHPFILQPVDHGVQRSVLVEHVTGKQLFHITRIQQMRTGFPVQSVVVL